MPWGWAGRGGCAAPSILHPSQYHPTWCWKDPCSPHTSSGATSNFCACSHQWYRGSGIQKLPFLPNFATGYGLCYPGLINTYGSPGSNSVIDEELVQWWGEKIVNFQSMFTVKIKTNAILPTVCFEMDFFFICIWRIKKCSYMQQG